MRLHCRRFGYAARCPPHDLLTESPLSLSPHYATTRHRYERSSPLKARDLRKLQPLRSGWNGRFTASASMGNGRRYAGMRQFFDRPMAFDNTTPPVAPRPVDGLLPSSSGRLVPYSPTKVAPSPGGQLNVTLASTSLSKATSATGASDRPRRRARPKALVLSPGVDHDRAWNSTVATPSAVNDKVNPLDRSYFDSGLPLSPAV